MNPLEENKWGSRGKGLIQGGEASRGKLGKGYPGAKGWEGCLKEREQHKKSPGDKSCEWLRHRVERVIER